MGIFTYIRENKYFFNTIVFSLLFVFVVANAQGLVNILNWFAHKPRIHVGIINNKKINKGEYNYFFQQRRQRFMGESGSEDPILDLRAHYWAWEDLINKYAYQAHQKEVGISVPKGERIEIVQGKENMDPGLKKNIGNLSEWKKRLRTFAKKSPRLLNELEKNLAEKRGREKFLFLSIKGLLLSFQRFVPKGRVDIAYFKIPMSQLEKKYGPQSPSQEQIKEYYEKNKAQYKRDKEVVLSWLHFESFASEEDRDNLRAELKQVVEVLKKAKNKTEKLRIARSYMGGTEKDSCQVSFNQEKLPLLLKAALKKNKKAIIGPVLTENNSYAIYVPIGNSTKARIQGKQHFIKIEKTISPSPHTIRNTFQEAKEVAKKKWRSIIIDRKNMIQKITFKKSDIQKKFNLGYYNFITKKPAQWALSPERREGDTSDPIDIGEGYAICHIEKISPEAVKSLEAVETDIRMLLENKLYEKCMAEELNQMGIREMTIDKLKKIAHQYNSSIRIKRNLLFDITQKIPGVKKAYKIIGAAFGLKVKGFTITSDGRSIFFVTRLPRKAPKKRISELNFSSLKKKHEKKTHKVRTELQNSVDLFIKKLAKITDERFLFY